MWRSVIPVFLILLVALALRLPQLNDSFWLDEAAQALESTRPLSQQLQIAQDFQPPLFHLIIHAVAQLNRSEWWLRTFGALTPGLLTILLVMKWPRQSAATRWIAGAFLAVSSFHIYYSQELRPYTLAALWVTLGWWLLLQLNTHKQYKWPLLAVTMAGLYTSYLHPFVLLGQLLFLHQRLKQSREAVWLLCVSTLLYLPWIPSLFNQLHVGRLVQATVPNWSQVVGTPLIKAIPLVFGKFFFGVLDLSVSWSFIWLTLAIGGLLLWLAGHQLKKLRQTEIAGVITYWLMIPLSGVFLFSLLIPIMQPKRVLLLLPAVFLIVASLIDRSSATKVFKIGCLVVLLGTQLFATWSYLTQPQLQRENWRELIARLESEIPSPRLIAFAFNGPLAPWQWYAKSTQQVFAHDTLVVSEPQQAKWRSRLAQQPAGTHVVLFAYLADLTDPQHLMQQTLEQAAGQPIAVYTYSQIGLTKVYQLKERSDLGLP